MLSPSSVSMLLAAAGNQIFFPLSGPVNGGIGAYDVLSATQHTVVPVAVGVTELLADADRIFWVDINSSGGSTVHAIGADGTGAVLLGTGRGIFEDDQALYWTSGGNIIRAPKADLSSRISLVTGSIGIGVAAAYGANVYWCPAESSNKVLSMPAGTDGTDRPDVGGDTGEHEKDAHRDGEGHGRSFQE